MTLVRPSAVTTESLSKQFPVSTINNKITLRPLTTETDHILPQVDYGVYDGLHSTLTLSDGDYDYPH